MGLKEHRGLLGARLRTSRGQLRAEKTPFENLGSLQRTPYRKRLVQVRASGTRKDHIRVLRG